MEQDNLKCEENNYIVEYIVAVAALRSYSFYIC